MLFDSPDVRAVSKAIAADVVIGRVFLAVHRRYQ
jgi:hypothetical protein